VPYRSAIDKYRRHYKALYTCPVYFTYLLAYGYAQMVTVYSPLTWGLYTEPPADVPECGFVGELCLPPVRGRWPRCFNVTDVKASYLGHHNWATEMMSSSRRTWSSAVAKNARHMLLCNDWLCDTAVARFSLHVMIRRTLAWISVKCGKKCKMGNSWIWTCDQRSKPVRNAACWSLC